jgi:hypothetical protein
MQLFKKVTRRAVVMQLWDSKNPALPTITRDLDAYINWCNQVCGPLIPPPHTTTPPRPREGFLEAASLRIARPTPTELGFESSSVLRGLLLLRSSSTCPASSD